MGIPRTFWAAAGIAAAAVGVTTPPALAGSGGSRTPEVTRVEVRDDCDPSAFALPDGTQLCAPDHEGGTTIAELDAELHERGDDVLRRRDALGWKFAGGDTLSVKAGGSVLAVNTGGEAHTFTRVASFGPGCIPDLNEPLGLTGLDPLCPGPYQLPGPPLLPGASVTTEPLGPGTHHFECLLHPWMRTTVHVS